MTGPGRDSGMDQRERTRHVPTDRYCSCCRICTLNQNGRETDVGSFVEQPSGDHNEGAHHDETHRQHHDEPGQDDGHAHVDHAGHEAMFRRRFVVCSILALPVLAYSPTLQAWLGFTVPAFPGNEFVAPILGTVIFAYGGVPFLRMGAVEARNRDPGMMLLISLAITVAFVYSIAAVGFGIGEPFFWELVTLIVIFLLGHWIEMRSVRRASGALDELAKLLPDTAERVTDGGSTEEVPISSLTSGDVVLVRPGASVPADGVVESGKSDVNEAMLTGESRAAEKEPGDDVIGGTINEEGSLRVRVTATGDETTLSGIVRLVEQAQQSESRTQVLADRAAGWLFYTALAVAVITGAAWTAAVGFGLPVVERVVTVLVIACPHALGLAVPLVVAINTTMAANDGMLVRDRIAMEMVRNVDVVVFDKTGTLTEGEHGVVDVATAGDLSEDDALALMAAAERDSEHVLARAIRDRAFERNVSIPETEDFEALSGRGVRATLDSAGIEALGTGQTDGDESDRESRVTVHVGGPNLLRYLDIEPGENLKKFAERAGTRGEGVVYLIHGDGALAAVALADVVREESRQAVQTLQAMGIDVAMLTGDSADVARAVADDLGIETVFAEVLPADKDEKIIELQDRGNQVAMVGDGVNDAPALVRADVGIAIGSGTDVAVESADVILVENDPMDVVKLIRLSQASYRKMQENILWAAGYNVFALPLAAGILAPIGILLSPAVGAILMSASTVIVAVNAQLLRRADLG